MKRVYRIDGLVFGALLLIAAARSGVQAAGFGSGVYRGTYDAEESLSFEDGTRTQKFNLIRRSLQVPKSYGRLVAITGQGGPATLWFESDSGEIRNVTVSDDTPLVIVRGGASSPR